MRALRGLGPALVVGGAFTLFLVNTLGAGWTFAIASSSAIGLGIWAVVSSRPTERDRMADEAWLAAAPDLPPESDRRTIDAKQATIPEPERKRAAGRAPRRRGDGTPGADQ
jgi:hypothetical protein